MVKAYLDDKKLASVEEPFLPEECRSYKTTCDLPLDSWNYKWYVRVRVPFVFKNRPRQYKDVWFEIPLGTRMVKTPKHWYEAWVVYKNTKNLKWEQLYCHSFGGRISTRTGTYPGSVPIFLLSFIPILIILAGFCCFAAHPFGDFLWRWFYGNY